MGKARRVQLELQVTGASGGDYADWPARSPTSPWQASGKVTGVVARLETGGGWTFTSMRLKVADLRYTTATASADVKDEHLCFDSDTVLAPAASATAGFIEERFANAPQPYTDGFRVFLESVTSAGSGTSTVQVVVEIEED
ncbi:MAG TPA: hypothetical protein VFV33_01610 [Gemmatimonadaceae bacterium]|nr:hypothetical protein [Gemmatimonadaceae bacterium]